MNIVVVEGCNDWLGKPPGWDESRGSCEGLPIKRTDIEGMPVMVSAWKPTEEELSQLIAGAPIHLWVCGANHPPVAIKVGFDPE